MQRARDEGHIEAASTEDLVQALGALGAEADPVLANVLATSLLNRSRRALAILDTIADAVVALDDEGRILYSNRAAERLLGWPGEELVGQDLHDLVHHTKASGSTVERDDCRLLAALSADDATAVREEDHDVFRRRDGSTFYVGFSASPTVIEEGVMGLALVFRDITRAKTHEAEQALYRAALDAVAEPVVWVDREGAFLYVNRHAADHLGYPEDALLGMSVFDVDVDMSPEDWTRHWERVKTKGKLRLDTRHRRSDGRVVPVTLVISHVEQDDREFHVAVARLPET